MTDSPRQQPAPTAGPTAPVVSLEAELTCSICTDLLYNPLTLLDCLHTFCGGCLKDWFGFQAIRVENAPGPPPPPEKPIYTCPSCRDAVRDTKHDARVNTLLEMYLSLNPGKGKTQEEKDEMDSKYKRGDKVMRRLKFQDRTPEQIRLDEEERRLLEQVQQMSLREATDAAARSAGRRSRDLSRAGAGTEGRRSRAHSGTVPSAEVYTEERRRNRRRSESRQPGSGERDSDRRQRQIEHQSSLRNLISGDDMDARDIEREIEEFARQIQEEGLLDGLDLNNIDLENNDELSRRITEAYRRRHRDRMRQDGGRRSNASAHSHRSDVSATRPRSITADGTSRPASRLHSRPPSTGSNEERSRYPPSTSTAAAHLDVQDSSTRRRRAPSSSRSATVPAPPTQPQAQPDTRPAARAQTDLSTRPLRPSMATVTDARASGSPTIISSPSRRDSPDNNNANLTFVASSTTRKITTTVTALPYPSSTSTPSSPSRAPPPPLPSIHCSACPNPLSPYALHYVCAPCSTTLCRVCYLKKKGCLHWFGFGGRETRTKWEKVNAVTPIPPPHMLTPRKYLKTGAVQTGAKFCASCEKWSDTFWRCEECNEGEWGYCTSCVGKGKTCVGHALTKQGDGGRLFPSCEVCKRPVEEDKKWLCCYSCGHNFCLGCYTSSATLKIAPENGLTGWRRCPSGHRMVVMAYDTTKQKCRVAQDLVGGRRVKISTEEGGKEIWSWKDENGNGYKRVVSSDVSITATTSKNGGEYTISLFPPDGGHGPKATAGWGWIPASGVEDELMFPKGADILEVEDVNGEWFHGFYMGVQGLFPAPYVRLRQQ
ncbi:E3 ubiquitin-protein ligase [Podospora fimiseda]|uniref:E3 ubiquitin-protein ligase n=1 Tax=Podospora fimiseda TaxID=252190 RepID=A0AAN7BXL9_9PEZI|nr:E3 ubiquitin-protein ligase [Podospora fimiseda]